MVILNLAVAIQQGNQKDEQLHCKAGAQKAKGKPIK